MIKRPRTKNDCDLARFPAVGQWVSDTFREGARAAVPCSRRNINALVQAAAAAAAEKHRPRTLFSTRPEIPKVVGYETRERSRNLRLPTFE